MGVGIVGEILDEVALVEVRRVAEADDLAEVDALGLRFTDRFDGVAAALGDETDVTAAARHAVLEGEAGGRTVKTHAVRPQQANAVLPGDGQHLVLEAGARRVADLRETGGEHVYRGHSLGGAVPQQRGGVFGGHLGDHEIHLVWDVQQAGIDLDAVVFPAVSADAVEFAFVTLLQVGVNEEASGPHLGQVGGDAGHRDRLRVKKVFQSGR